LTGTAVDSRAFVFNPSSFGRYQVDLQCGGVNVATCGAFFAGPQSGSISFVLNAAAPADVNAFKNMFAASVARAAGIDVSQVLVNSIIPNARRAATLTVSTTYLGSLTNLNQDTVQTSVAGAAQTGAINTQLTMAGLPVVATYSVNGGAAQPAGAAVITTVPNITPTPSTATTSVVSVVAIMSMLFTALLALF